MGKQNSHRAFHFDVQKLGFRDGRKGRGILGSSFILGTGWRLYSLGVSFWVQGVGRF